MIALSEKRYTVNFKHIGSAYDEALIILNELMKRENWDAVTSAAFEENFLKKKSSRWIDVLLKYTKKRYFSSTFLPDGNTLAKFLNLVDSQQAKIQALFQYICESHPLVDRLVVALVGSNLKDYGSFNLTKPLYYDFISKESEIHPELNEWADYTRNKWRRDFYSFLRTSGVMDKHPSTLVKKFIIKPETFAFFLYALMDNKLSPSEIFENRIWKRYFLSQEDIEENLSVCQVKGWLQYRSLGTIYELIPEFNSLEMWVNALK